MTTRLPQAPITIAPPSYTRAPAWGYAVYPPPTTALLEYSGDTRRLGDSTLNLPTKTTLEPGFVLYFPFSVTLPTVVTWPTLVSVLSEVYPGVPAATTPPALLYRSYSNVPIPFDELVRITSPVFSFSAMDTLYIPLAVSVAPSVDMNPGITSLRNAAPAEQTSIISSTNGSISATPNDGATTLTSPPAILQTVTPGPEDDDTPSIATLAGGIVGGVLAAILLCGLLGFFFVRRKRSKRSASATHAHASEKGDPNAPGIKFGMKKQEMNNANPLVVEVADSSAIPISDLWLAPGGGKPRWWQRLGSK
ncbi:hypothetical protein CKM354_000232300 [Cercospora kikuchii]|uniref:Uncharacterized protein n=1 Tax=Cercospora kikuchii TaxID=84275 RepID=A0A9P3FDL7_9PEZI|nr:uncharacterized protein CKM354_000232300 [Cercospora kikuchii]GIZ38924.1 hypothetical protein CKM354_000232300 [Cercospora kikuchii]